MAVGWNESLRHNEENDDDDEGSVEPNDDNPPVESIEGGEVRSRSANVRALGFLVLRVMREMTLLLEGPRGGGAYDSRCCQV